ncbi:AAA family ATPase [Desulfonatronum thioautotrophicum]|uniref:nucleotide-binding protein n=1 Tax=Desulfonatronum thioautotrophicum TaxID=617001 RepID=UPI00069B046D|nr:AAA family ATPase [Desulfonatronum thioautotrophicum]
MAEHGIRTIAVASGKGGAGKTSVALSLAWLLAEIGQRVCLVDVDMGLANVDVLLGITPKHTLDELFTSDLPAQAALCPVRPGLDILSGGSGTAILADLTPRQRESFLQKIRKLTNYDILLLDNSPGIHRQVVSFCLAAREQILVINPEPSSLVDGYALLKVLRQNGLHRPPYLLLNRVAPRFKAATLMERFGGVCAKHLRMPVLALGVIPDDPGFQAAAARQMLPMALSSPAPARDALARAARLLAGRTSLSVLYSEPEEFWGASLTNMFQNMHLAGIHSDNTASVPQANPQDSSSPSQRTFSTVLLDLESAVTELERISSVAQNPEPERGQRVREIGARLLDLAATLIGQRSDQHGDARPSGKKEPPAAARADGVRKVKASGRYQADQRPRQYPEHPFPPSSPVVVGIISPDQALRQLLHDVLLQRGYLPVMINGSKESGPRPEVLLGSASRTDASIAEIASEMAGTPWVWLSEYAQPPPLWAVHTTCFEVLQKPFTLEQVDAAIHRARACRAAKLDVA